MHDKPLSYYSRKRRGKQRYESGKPKIPRAKFGTRDPYWPDTRRKPNRYDGLTLIELQTEMDKLRQLIAELAELDTAWAAIRRYKLEEKIDLIHQAKDWQNETLNKKDVGTSASQVR